ncbi:MAG TPA: universal stress protein [bacterium]|nr:universal stress protein [bacterium]
MSIVCATDFSPTGARAATIAAGLAVRLGESLVLVHVLELPSFGAIGGEPIVFPLPGWTADHRRELEAHARENLAREKARLERRGIKVRTRIEVGDAAAELARIADDLSAPLLVTGSHGRGAAMRMVLGSVADRLTRLSPVPLLVVRGDSAKLEQWAEGGSKLDILTGVGDGDGLDNIAALARLFFLAGDCAFHYAHVVEIPAMQLYGGPDGGTTVELQLEYGPAAEDEILTLLRRVELPPPATRLHLLSGRPATELVEFAQRFDPGLMLLGTHGRKGLERALLGSVALGVLHKTHCPVAIAPCGRSS